ncbi:MAG: HPr family phosphocarrier protein [Lachnospiraceae bacterium]|nr:HPr family phosphocarrier protein [Lachnospiraceae bacterium]
MKSKEIVIGKGSVTEARPAAMLVQVASRFSSSIYIEQTDKKVNAKSIMGVMTLAFVPGDKVSVVVDGEDEEAALEGISALLES